MADVAEGRRAEDRVRDGVEEDVGVGVAGKARAFFDDHAAEHERARIVDAVEVLAQPDAHGHAGPLPGGC